MFKHDPTSTFHHQNELQSDELLAVIFKYMEKITAETDLDKLLMILADLGKNLVLADRCTVWLHNPESNQLWTIVAHGIDPVMVPEKSGFIGHSFSTGESIIVKDAYKDDRFNKTIDLSTGYLTKSVLCIPFRNSEGIVIGAFQAINKMTVNEIFSERDREILTLAASYSGKTLESSILRNELIETQREMIETMGEIGESRSQETGNHVKRVAEYSFTLAKLAGLTDSQAHLLKLASPMHDIGKVAIPDTILLKPGPLTKTEFELMKTHTTIGYNVFKHSNRELLRMAAIIAHEHHEKWNGTGYPIGLKENEIHIFGRITAIADVFDALTSERVYKKAWSIEEVISFLLEQRGKHFDPFLIDLFLLHIDTFIDIRYKYAADRIGD
ncbi:HD domain-containing phosphohydrolase [Paenisporosarcina sp. TG20]|uniref:HD domain-containing phosphohydrolase n=1 Tax=Paenisporosarcina sp. TG20 TaxID=1211706 RepID=UPI000301B336|nr:HD domain-containing phosphohydrolase [Paenisporosarcina sp. TG20]